MAILEMEDSDLKKFIPAYGDRLATVAFCRKQNENAATTKDGDNSTETQTSKLLDRLRNRFGTRKRKNAESSHPCSKNALNTKRALELGWMDYDFDTCQFRQVRKLGGGGTRSLNVEKQAGVALIIQEGQRLFFKDGKSKRGCIEEFEFSVQDFSGHEMDNDIGQLYEETSVKLLRVYMC